MRIRGIENEWIEKTTHQIYIYIILIFTSTSNSSLLIQVHKWSQHPWHACLYKFFITVKMQLFAHFRTSYNHRGKTERTQMDWTLSWKWLFMISIHTVSTKSFWRPNPVEPPRPQVPQFQYPLLYWPCGPIGAEGQPSDCLIVSPGLLFNTLTMW